ncbi:MAG TPA: hypothetical protein VN522_14025 [Solirubrobacterales bacterium]|nr:hypothetical protein [Solirubrobacterales bacterium]
MRSTPTQKLRLRGSHLHGLSLAGIALCLGLWGRAKTIGEDERGNAERRAIFVGLWPPMLWLIGDALRREETRRRGGLLRRS